MATLADEPAASRPRIDTRDLARKLGLAAIISIIFFSVSGGPYGLEDTIGESGPGMGLLLIILTPIFWALPTAFMVAELGTAVPVQGGFRWIDSLCIPVDAPNPEAANRFVNYYLEPEVSASNAVASHVDTGNAAAREFIPQEILDDPAVFPPADVLDLLVFIDDLGEDEKTYEVEWKRVKAD